MHLVCHYSLTPCSLNRVELASGLGKDTGSTKQPEWQKIELAQTVCLHGEAQLLIKQIVHVNALFLKRSNGDWESSLLFHVNETQLQV